MSTDPRSKLIGNRVHIGFADGVCRVQLARPQQGNALDLEMARAILQAVSWACESAQSGESRVITLEAQGDKFCVGGDLRFLDAAPDALPDLADAMHRALVLLSETKVPTVSVVGGIAAGGGVGLALSTDIIIASNRAALVSAYTAIGLAPDCGTSWQLARRLGPTRSMDLMLTNRRVSAEEALTWGLFTRVVPSTELGEVADEVVKGLVQGSRDALVRAKALVNAAHSATLEAHLDREAWAVTRSAVDGDGRAGIKAFLA